MHKVKRLRPYETLKPVQRLVLFGCVIGTVLGLAACTTQTPAPNAQSTGGASSTNSTSPHIAAPTNNPPPKYSDIGTITAQLAQGGSVSAQYSIGNPIMISDDSSPPAAVFNACGISQSDLADTSVAIPGQVTVSYAGNISQNVYVADGDIAASNYQALAEAIESNGQWSCFSPQDDSPGGYQINLSPGQSTTSNIWVIMYLVITNDAPTFVPSQHPDLAFYGGTIQGNSIADNTSAISPWSVTGPHAFTCGDDNNALSESERGAWISLFSSPPFSIQSDGDTIACTSP
jgi:hypothetical protein